jgi:excisionase family DNA binding protein
MFLTAAEVAELLRTSRVAVYAMAARGALPGATRLRRRLLIQSAALVPVGLEPGAIAEGVGDGRESQTVSARWVGGGHHLPPAERNPAPSAGARTVSGTCSCI